jgi:hypothetical protein
MTTETTKRQPLMASLRVTEDEFNTFKQKCREQRLTQSAVIGGFINAWNEGEYVHKDAGSENIRAKFAAWVRERGFEPSEVLDVIMNSVISGKILLEDGD